MSLLLLLDDDDEPTGPIPEGLRGYAGTLRKIGAGLAHPIRRAGGIGHPTRRGGGTGGTVLCLLVALGLAAYVLVS